MNVYRNQWRALLLMVPAWAVAGLVHNGVSFLFPYFSDAFGLSTAHNGYLAGTLAFFWTLSILLSGPRADRVGQLPVMALGFLLGAAALAALACARGIAMLYLFTAVAGFGCGTVVSASFSFLAEQSDPRRRGLVYGAAQSSFTLIGSALGAVVFTRLASTVAGWRGCYAVIAGLVLLVALVLWIGGRRIPRGRREAQGEAQSFRLLLHYPNVVLSTGLACLAMMWYFSVAAYTILYLMEARALSAVAAGAIFAGFGSGGFVGEFGAPLLSDRLGRKPTALIAVVLGGGCFAAFVLADLPAFGMTLALAGASCFMSGAMAILNSVVPSESVPPHLVATATAFTPACGEFMGGVLAPVACGLLSGLVGTVPMLRLLMALPVLVGIGLLFLRETAPSRLTRTGRSG